MDIKTTGSVHKTGDLRRYYLDLANNAFAMTTYEGFAQCEGHLTSFEATLEPGSNAKKELLRYKEQETNEKAETVREWDKWRLRQDYWHQYDVQPQRDSIEIIYLKKYKEFCWDLAARTGLFND
jgi:hypothetical protein